MDQNKQQPNQDQGGDENKDLNEEKPVYQDIGKAEMEEDEEEQPQSQP